MSANYDGEPTPAGTIGTPSDPPPGAGHTNNAKGLGQRRSTSTLSRHFDGPNLASSDINRQFWETFLSETRQRYRQAPNLHEVDLRHPMHPNTAPPIEGDDLDAVSPGDSLTNSVAMTPNTNWPLQGPTAFPSGPTPSQNPSNATLTAGRINLIFAEGRVSRWDA